MNPRVAIILGHTKLQPGSRGSFPINQMEYDWNDALALDLWRELKTIGYDCMIFKRDGLTIKKVGDMVSTWAQPNGVAIELHCNSFDSKVIGTETLYDAQPQESKDFAEIVHRYVCRALERSGKRGDRGVKLLSSKDLDKSNDRGSVNVESVTVPSCLVEPAFWDSRTDSALLHRKRQEYIRALVGAVTEWYIKAKLEEEK